MYDFLSTGCRAFRYCVSGIGFCVATAFLVYSVLLRDQDSSSLENTLMIAFGVFVAVQSCIIVTMHGLGDKLVSRLVHSMEAQLSQLKHANEALSAEIATFDLHNKNYRDAIAEHKAQNAEYKEQLGRAEQTQHNLEATLGKVRRAQADSERQVAELRQLGIEERVRVEELEELCGTQRETIEEMSKQLRNLNELQRRSVKMIQMLSVYGDDCKTLGINLRDVSSELRKTDESLGLSTQELQAQLRALRTVTSQLKGVAVQRGEAPSDGEEDDTDFTSTESSPAV